MRLLVILVASAVTLGIVTAPASAITEEDLRDLRLELQDALGQLEAATWDERVASDSAGLVQFEYDELAGDAEAVLAEQAERRSLAAGRSLALFVGAPEGPWYDRTIGRRYLEAALGADRGMVSAHAELVDGLETDLEFLQSEIDGFAATAADAAGRVDELSRRVDQLDAEYADLAAAYEAELRYNATTTTSSTIATTTTATATTTTTTPATTTTSISPPAATTTTLAAGTTTTTVPVDTTTTTTTVMPSTTTTTVPALPVDGLICPVQGPHHFRDSWGDPRSGGRTHQGVDMMADRGTPLVAIESGTVVRLSDGGLGGITVWLAGDGGDEYYYAHLDAWAPGLVEGQRLAAGETLGTVGSTGNAPEEWPHLHFEIHPGGGDAVNPYPTVDAICP